MSETFTQECLCSITPTEVFVMSPKPVLSTLCQARELGSGYKDNSWVNLGQGAPETGVSEKVRPLNAGLLMRVTVSIVLLRVPVALGNRLRSFITTGFVKGRNRNILMKMWLYLLGGGLDLQGLRQRWVISI